MAGMCEVHSANFDAGQLSGNETMDTNGPDMVSRLGPFSSSAPTPPRNLRNDNSNTDINSSSSSPQLDQEQQIQTDCYARSHSDIVHNNCSNTDSITNSISDDDEHFFSTTIIRSLSRHDLRKRKTAPVSTSSKFLTENEGYNRKLKKTRLNVNGRSKTTGSASQGATNSLGLESNRKLEKSYQPKSKGYNGSIKIARERKTSENSHQAIRERAKGKATTLPVLREKVFNGSIYIKPESSSPRINDHQESLEWETTAFVSASGDTRTPSPISSLVFTQGSDDFLSSSPEPNAFADFRRSDEPTPSPTRVSSVTCFGSGSVRCVATPMSQVHEDSQDMVGDITIRPMDMEESTLPYPSSTPRPQRTLDVPDSWLGSSPIISEAVPKSPLFDISLSIWSAPPSTPCPAGIDTADAAESSGVDKINAFLTPNVLDDKLNSDTELGDPGSSPQSCTASSLSHHSRHIQYMDDQESTNESDAISEGRLDASPVASSVLGLGSFSLSSQHLETIPRTRTTSHDSRRDRHSSTAASPSPSPLNVCSHVDDASTAILMTGADSGYDTVKAANDDEVPIPVSMPMFVSAGGLVGVERVGQSMFTQMQEALSLSERQSTWTSELETLSDTVTESLSTMEIPSAAISSDQTEDKVSNEKRADHGSNESSSKQRSRSYSILGFPTSLIPSSSTSDSCSMFVTAVTPVVQPVVLPSEDVSPFFLAFPFASLPSSSQLQDRVTPSYRPVSQADSDPSRASQEQRLHPFPVYFIDLLRARLEDPFTTPTDSDASGTAVYDSSSSPTSTSGASIGGNLMSGQNQMTWMIRLPESTSSMSSSSNCSEAIQSDVIQASTPLSDPSSLATFSDENDDSTSSSDVGHEDEQVSKSNEDEATLTFFDSGLFFDDPDLPGLPVIQDLPGTLDSSPQSPLCFSEEFLLQEGIELLGGDDLDPFAELYKTPSEECLSASSPEDTMELASGPSSELGQQDVEASFKVALEECDDPGILTDIDQAFQEMMKEIESTADGLATLLSTWSGSGSGIGTDSK
ncbi:hypothetical protein K435DRAFT_966002 [Dendrothele bispora CBS 962.96]|uniref:Uncharacterized protein n=1 Tax=Dendrothele bispora (strain CBS 962.96) TaxID=1314807 RepID=A0A4S8M2B0_DENBC|nr:hypothetical protein K435DRAFT_966002 [Dendrothele bispora CBS 962.96]